MRRIIDIMYDLYEFEKEILYSYRYTENKRKHKFITNFKKILKNNIQVIKRNTIFARAQRGCDFDDDERPCPFNKDRMMPDKAYAISGGRINPNGIVYLYLSNNIDTALSECRPWINEHLTLAKFKTVKDLKVISFIDNPKSYFPWIKLKKYRENEIILNEINRRFAIPINEYEKDKYYLTQVLGEIIKSEGFDGVVYKTLLGKGWNVLLFNIADAIPISGEVYQLKDIAYTFENIEMRIQYK